MSDDTVTIDDLRESEGHDEDESDLDVVYNEFETILGGMKAAIFMLQSKKDIAGAIEALRDTLPRATDLQMAVLGYMADVEDAEAEDGDEDEDEEDEDDEGGEGPSSSESDAT